MKQSVMAVLCLALISVTAKKEKKSHLKGTIVLATGEIIPFEFVKQQ
jgi:hypothetical protein